MLIFYTPASMLSVMGWVYNIPTVERTAKVVMIISTLLDSEEMSLISTNQIISARSHFSRLLKVKATF